jgi:hypothetical protein
VTRGSALPSHTKAGLPDCFFQTQNPILGKFWRALDWKLSIYFYGRLEYFTDIWDILRPFGTFCVHLVHFPGFGIMQHRKIWQPWTRATLIER